MSMRWLALVCVLLLVGGCHTPPLQEIDQTMSNIASHPFDVAPNHARKPVDAGTPAAGSAPAAEAPSQDRPQALPPPLEAPPPAARPPAAADAAPSAAATGRQLSSSGPVDGAVVRTSFTQPDSTSPEQAKQALQRFELTIPPAVPGSETPAVRLPSDRARQPEAIARLFPQMPALPPEPAPLPGPSGRAYTLADLQGLAAANNPALRQAASDIAAARGLMIQAGLYPNPIVGYETSPNANNTASTSIGAFIDQTIKTGGKLTLARAAAQMGVAVSELALKRARFNLATTIRGDYYTLLVAKETVRVNKALAHFTDEIFRLQADLLGGGFAASHEPAALRSQAFIVRLGYQQAIANYVYAWKQLVADIGLRQLPLSQVEGEVDRLIPYYDYDVVLAHVIRNHTDILTARYNLDAARYNLKLAQVTPVPDVDVRADLWKEHQVQPLQNYFTFQIGIPFPIWNRNQGGIINATAAMYRAAEGPHAAEVNLTTNLATAYATYRANLYSMDYYRRNILPDQVRYYRGIFQRRQVDPGVAFGDLVQAQQTLVADVTTYLGILNSLWTSVVGVADFLQTDDLFQLGKPMELPRIPDLESLHVWPCPHPDAQWRASASVKPPPENSATLPGALESPVVGPTSMAAQPVAQAPGPLGQDPSRRSSTLSLWSSP